MTGHTETRRPGFMDGRLRLGIFSAFLLCAGIWLAVLCRGLPPQGWLDALLLLLALAATVAGLTRDLPLQNALMAIALAAFVSGIIQIVNAKTGIPFGALSYTESSGARIFGLVPWPVPLLCAVAVLNSRGAARLILRRWPNLPSRGLWTIGLASLLAVATDLSLEPFAVEVRRFWSWRTTPKQFAWHTVPWPNYLAGLIVTFLILVLAAPWLIDKRPVKNPPPNPYPFWLWLAVNLLLAVANASHGLWDSAAFGFLSSLAVGILAWRSARA